MKNFWLNNELHLWEVDDGEQHWYSAYSKKDALEQYLEPMRNPITKELEYFDQDDIDEIEISQVSDDFILPVRQYDGDLITKTAKQWCKDGRGMVASTVY